MEQSQDNPQEKMGAVKLKEKTQTKKKVSTVTGIAILVLVGVAAAGMMWAGKRNRNSLLYYLKPWKKAGYKVGHLVPGYNPTCEPKRKPGYERCLYKVEKPRRRR